MKFLLELAQPFVGTRLYGLPDFRDNEPGFEGSSGDHVGKVETSQMWALEPDCVDMSRLSDRRIGERMAADETRWLGAKLQELHNAYRAESPAQRLETFAELETLWETVIAPRLPEFKTMQLWDESAPPPENSVWRANWPLPLR